MKSLVEPRLRLFSNLVDQGRKGGGKCRSVLALVGEDYLLWVEAQSLFLCTGPVSVEQTEPRPSTGDAGVRPVSRVNAPPEGVVDWLDVQDFSKDIDPDA